MTNNVLLLTFSTCNYMRTHARAHTHTHTYTNTHTHMHMHMHTHAHTHTHTHKHAHAHAQAHAHTHTHTHTRTRTRTRTRTHTHAHTHTGSIFSAKLCPSLRWSLHSTYCMYYHSVQEWQQGLINSLGPTTDIHLGVPISSRWKK